MEDVLKFRASKSGRGLAPDDYNYSIDKHGVIIYKFKGPKGSVCDTGVNAMKKGYNLVAFCFKIATLKVYHWPRQLQPAGPFAFRELCKLKSIKKPRKPRKNTFSQGLNLELIWFGLLNL
jgi:hypothetical protein